MNRNQAILLAIAILTIPLISFFIPDDKPGTISSLAGVTLSNVNGQNFKLSGMFSDKPILFAFWSVTCYNCIQEIPFIIKLHKKFRDKLTIIGIHPPGFPRKKIKRFLKKHKPKIPYMIAIDSQMALSQNYEVTIMPKIVLTDRKGKILYSHIGYIPEKEQEVEKAISEKL